MRLPKNSNWTRAAAASLGLWLLAGCNVGPKYQPPTAPSLTAYTPQPQPAETASSAGLAGVAQHFDSLGIDSRAVVDAVSLA